jgi:hypothetical protein
MLPNLFYMASISLITNKNTRGKENFGLVVFLMNIHEKYFLRKIAF